MEALASREIGLSQQITRRRYDSLFDAVQNPLCAPPAIRDRERPTRQCRKPVMGVPVVDSKERCAGGVKDAAVRELGDTTEAGRQLPHARQSRSESRHVRDRLWFASQACAEGRTTE